MLLTASLKQPSATLNTTAPAWRISVEDRWFCPSMFCFTDEITARRVNPNTDAWLLSDETTNQNWFMMGEQPTCPHCGTTLLDAEHGW